MVRVPITKLPQDTWQCPRHKKFILTEQKSNNLGPTQNVLRVGKPLSK